MKPAPDLATERSWDTENGTYGTFRAFTLSDIIAIIQHTIRTTLFSWQQLSAAPLYEEQNSNSDRKQNQYSEFFLFSNSNDKWGENSVGTSL